MPRTKASTIKEKSVFQLKPDNSTRTIQELKRLYNKNTGKSPLTKNKAQTLAFKKWKDDYKRWEKKAISEVSAPKPRAKPAGKKSTRAKGTPKTIGFKETHIRRIIKAVMDNHISPETIKALKDKYIPEFAKEIQSTLITFMAERRKIMKADIEQVSKIIPFGRFTNTKSIAPEGTPKTSTKAKCKGINQTAVRHYIINKKTLSSISGNALPLLCDLFLRYIQGIAKSIDKINSVYKKKTISKETLEVVMETIDLAMGRS